MVDLVVFLAILIGSILGIAFLRLRSLKRIDAAQEHDHFDFDETDRQDF
jgi:hypothetical protein